MVLQFYQKNHSRENVAMLGVFCIVFEHPRAPQENQISNLGSLEMGGIRHMGRGKYRYELKLLQLDFNFSKPC